MHVIQIDLTNRYQLDQFVRLPFRLYRDNPYWVPPLLNDLYSLLDVKKNPFFKHSDAAFFLVLSDNHPQKAVARVAILNHKPFNKYNRSSRAFFFLFESEDNTDAIKILFDAACTWARSQGLTEIYGPKGFSALDALGLLVNGYDLMPALGVPYHLPYAEKLLLENGFTPASDVLSGRLSQGFQLPEKVHQVAERVRERKGLRIATFKSRKDLQKLFPYLQEMYNGAIEGTAGNCPLDASDIKAIANQLLWFADLRLIKFLMKDDHPVGFLFAYPDISRAIQSCQGRLWPFGWLKILRHARKTDWLNINGIGIVDEFRGAGGTAILFSELEKSIDRKRFTHVEIVQIGADNERMLRELRQINVDFYKTHRLYLRAL